MHDATQPSVKAPTQADGSGGYMLTDDGRRWLRIVSDDGNEHDEPITGWTLLHVLQASTRAEIGAWWRHKDGRQIKALHP